jgi:hypothetical protein
VSSTGERPVGGFIGLELPLAERSDGVLALWTAGRSWVGFANARSALAALLRRTGSQRLWLPTFYCPHTAAALDGVLPLQFYPVSDDLGAPPATLKGALRSGDAAVVVCYFGARPDAAWDEVREEHPAVLWIEDRAQALWIDSRPAHSWMLYSPRKVLGVPDGGILVGDDQRVSGELRPEIRRDPGFLAPALLRFEDAREDENERWYRAFCEREDAEGISTTSMSRLTRKILSATPMAPLAEKRRANHLHLRRRLADRLPPFAFREGGAPWAYATRTRGAEAVARRLHAQRLFVSRLWRRLPSGAEDPRAQAIADELLLLPCDHRYGTADMDRLADALLDAVR